MRHKPSHGTAFADESTCCISAQHVSYLFCFYGVQSTQDNKNGWGGWFVMSAITRYGGRWGGRQK